MISVLLQAIENDADREFMTDLFERHVGLMYSRIGKIVSDSWVIEDVLQNTVEKLIDRIPLLRSIDNYLDLSHQIILSHDEKYGTVVYPFAVHKAYGYAAIRSFFEYLNDYSKSHTDSNIRTAYTDAIQDYDTSGSFSEAFEKCAAWSMYSNYFYEDYLTGVLSNWIYTPPDADIAVLDDSGDFVSKGNNSLEGMSFRHFTFQTETTTNKTLTVTLDFNTSGSICSARTLKCNADKTNITPIGGDVPTGRYTVVVTNFSSSGISEVTVVGINTSALTSNIVHMSAEVS